MCACVCTLKAYLDAVDRAPISHPPSISSSESCPSIGGILDCGNGASANKSPSNRPAAGSSAHEKVQKSQLECAPNSEIDEILTTKTTAAKTIVGDHL